MSLNWIIFSKHISFDNVVKLSKIKIMLIIVPGARVLRSILNISIAMHEIS